jgi:hypothetical protein
VIRRILALAAVATLMPFAALADDIGAGDDIVVEPVPVERETVTVVKETIVEVEKPVSLPPPGWRAPQSNEDSKR